MKQFKMFIQDVCKSLKIWRFWMHLGWEDVARQYRRSFLGPIWITLNTSIFIVVFGLIGAQLFSTNANEYLPYLCAGHVFFTALTSIMNEGCQTYIQAGPFLKQAPFPKMVFVLRVVWRNLIMLAHNVPIVFLVLGFTSGLTVIRFGWLLFGLAIFSVFSILMVSILGLVAARFRDVPMIVTSAMQIAFFVTPVMWRPEQLTTRAQWSVLLNPLAALLELVRAPLIGLAPSDSAVMLGVATVAMLLLVCCMLYTLARRRIVYWI